MPKEVPAYGVNILCGSGLKSVALGYQAILNGDSSVVVAGGQESMSMAPHCAYLRTGQKIGSIEFLDTMLKDGLIDAFQNYHMGTTAENVAQKWQITRDDQDKFAVASQNKAEAAVKGRPKDEITPVTIQTRKGDVVVDTDERGSGPPWMAWPSCASAFSKDGTVTAGNASGINDGAAAVVLMTADEAKRRGLGFLARADRLVGTGRRRSSDHGHRPDPSFAQGAREGWLKADDLDLVEANEAFAAQAIAVNKDMGWDTGKVNVNGGAIAPATDRRFGRACW